MIEGKANGELSIVDVEVALDEIHGALSRVALMQITRTGTLDADGVADRLIPVMMQDLQAA